MLSSLLDRHLPTFSILGTQLVAEDTNKIRHNSCLVELKFVFIIIFLFLFLFKKLGELLENLFLGLFQGKCLLLSQITTLYVIKE